MATESEIKAANKFNKEKTKVIPVRLNLKKVTAFIVYKMLRRLDN